MFGRREREEHRRRLADLEMITTGLSQSMRNTETRVDAIGEQVRHKVDRDELHALKVEMAEMRGMMQRCLDVSQSVNSGLERVERYLMDTTSQLRTVKAQVREMNEEEGSDA